MLFFSLNNIMKECFFILSKLFVISVALKSTPFLISYLFKSDF